METILSQTLSESRQWLALLLDTAAKGAVILACAGVAAVGLRRASAAARHMIWSLAATGLICLPALSLLLPGLPLPILLAGAAPLAGEPPLSPASPPAAMSGIDLPSPVPPTAAPPAPSVRLSVPEATVSESNTPDQAGSAVQSVHWSAWALLAWALGAAALLLPLALGSLVMRLQMRRTVRIADPAWLTLVDQLRRRLGIRRGVALLQSRGADIPVTCGLWRPAIILPAGAADWTPQRRQVVLLHELAHVRRADCLTQMVVRLARALYWFNPLVWVAAKAARVERERACDDLVLASGAKPSEYAWHLLEIVRTLRPARFPALAVVGMARKPQFEGRMRAILDATRNRRSPGRLGALLGVVLLGGLVVFVSALKVTAADTTQDVAAPATQPATRPANSGVTKVVVVSLKNATAEAAAGFIGQHVRGLVVSADERTNAVILSGTEKDVEVAMMLIQQLDQQPGPPAKGKTLSARFQAAVYQVSVFAGRPADLADLDARALSAKAAGPTEFQKHLEGIGPTKVLYAVDQVVNLAVDSRINIGAQEPVVTGAQSRPGGPAYTVTYQSLGGTFLISGRSDKILEVCLKVELSALSDSSVQVAADVRPPIQRRATIQYDGPVEWRRPFVAVSVDAASDAQKGPAIAFICRAVVSDVKP